MTISPSKLTPINFSGDDEDINNFVTASSPGQDDKARLQQVLAEIGGMSDDSGATDDDKAVADFLGETDTKNKKLASLQKEADRLQVKTQRADLKQELQEIEIREALRDEDMSQQQKIANAVNDKAVTPTVNAAKTLIQKVSSLPTAGSIGLLLAILILLLFVVVNVDGKGTTRLKQLWYMLNGRAQLKNRVSPTKGNTSAPTTTGANLPGVNNGSSTGQGAGSLPTAGKQSGTVDKAKFTSDDASLMGKLTIGNGNMDVIDQWNALNANFAVSQDVLQNADPSKLQSDVNQLQASLNKLNDPLYNSEYMNVYHDLGF